ncbi:MAG: polymerase [Myxococcaceae bacterium]|nr:polymerase [Myxococcaceae bacterium]
MDAFYASVEQRDRPELRGRPVCVGGSPEKRGVVAACSYEARKFGIHSAMPASQASRLCPSATFLRPRFDLYAQISREIRGIFLTVTDRVEPLSLDEAYLDVTENKLSEPLAGKLARHLRVEIKRLTGLTASAGVGPCKLVAKIASDVNKPDGLCVVPPDEVAAFLAPLPVTRLWGVGPATASRLAELNIKTVADVRGIALPLLEQKLGRYAEVLARMAWGDDTREVCSSRVPKSSGSETTFQADLSDPSELCEALESLSQDVAADLSGRYLRARTATLKLRYADFKTITRSRTFEAPIPDAAVLYRAMRELMFAALEERDWPVRLLGVSASSFAIPGQPEQLLLPFEVAMPNVRSLLPR